MMKAEKYSLTTTEILKSLKEGQIREDQKWVLLDIPIVLEAKIQKHENELTIVDFTLEVRMKELGQAKQEAEMWKKNRDIYVEKKNKLQIKYDLAIGKLPVISGSVFEANALAIQARKELEQAKQEVEGAQEAVYAQWKKECDCCREKSQGALAIKAVAGTNKIVAEFNPEISFPILGHPAIFGKEKTEREKGVVEGYYKARAAAIEVVKEQLEHLRVCLMLKQTKEK